MSDTDAETGITEAVATIDNGSFGTRTIRFETGRLAKQAAGSVVAYLDEDTMLLSATTAGKSPKDQFDFFPLTVDVEERMYAAGRIPGSFFRREGRPSEDAILTCRLIDRPLRPTFIKGLRNEVQVVITVMALNPDHAYDVLAINAASASTQISGLPFNGPVGATRVALVDGQWVGFPTHTELERATFDMVVAGRLLNVNGESDVAIMMVEAEATENTIELVAGGATKPTEEVVAAGLEAAKPFIATLCRAQSELAAAAAKETREFPVFLDYQDDVLAAVTDGYREATATALTIADKQDRELELDRIKDQAKTELAEQVRRSREGDQRRLPVADQDPDPPAGAARQGAHRRPGPDRHPHAVGRGRGAAAGARLGAVRARRDPDPGRHHAEHAGPGAEARHPEPEPHQALHAQLQLPAVLHR